MPTKEFDSFIGKYGTPLAILIGSVVIAAGIFFSLSGDQPQSNQPDVAGRQTPQGPTTQNIDTAGLPMLGQASAPVTMVEFGDFQCPFCGRFARDTLPSIKKDYIDTGQVKFFYNDFSFLGAESFQAAEAAKCADDQGQFWAYHDYLYSNQQGENQGAFSDDNLKKFAAALGLDQSRFDSCLTAKKYEQAVRDETDRGRQYGVNSTPTSFVGGEMVRGALPYDAFKAKIEEKLKK